MRLRYRTWGNLERGGPLVLLLHGATGWSNTWWRVGPAVASAGYSVVAVDLYGHGGSPAPVGRFSVTGLITDLTETLHAAVGSEPLDVVWGHSLGGLLAIEVLTRDAEFARCAIIVDPPIRPGNATEIDEVIRGWTAHAILARQEPAALATLLRRQTPEWDQRDRDEAVASMGLVDLDVLIAGIRRRPTMDPMQALAGLPVPALIILGREERGSVVVGPDRDRMCAVLPRHVDVLELDAGHVVHRDAYESYIASTLAWLTLLARLPARGLAPTLGRDAHA